MRSKFILVAALSALLIGCVQQSTVASKPAADSVMSAQHGADDGGKVWKRNRIPDGGR